MGEDEDEKFVEADFDDAYSKFDTDGNGRISKQEMFEFIQRVAGYDKESQLAAEEALKREEAQAKEKADAERIEAEEKEKEDKKEIDRREKELDDFVQKQILRYGEGNSEKANKEAKRRNMKWDEKLGKYIKEETKNDDDFGYLAF